MVHKVENAVNFVEKVAIEAEQQTELDMKAKELTVDIEKRMSLKHTNAQALIVESPSRSDHVIKSTIDKVSDLGSELVNKRMN